ncbi:MAG: cupin domain-containing protein [Chloroflexi bacterium]|nr:cupin domain-containing protein [Chloroflexota bacterium]
MTTTTGSIRVIKPEQATQQTTQTPGMVRHEVISHPGAWVGVARTAPGVTSGWHHHGDHETFIYVAAGQVRMEFGPGGRDACDAQPGDFIHVPKGAIHRESNPSDVEQVLVLVRVGTGAPVFNVDGSAA